MKFSIITASYNYQDYIKETIESVLAQTYANWEMIIVDDGSSDNSVNVIKAYCEKDERIKLFQHENGANKGLKDTVLLGIKKAQSEWVVFLESDDTICPDYLQEKLSVIKENADVKFIFNDVNMFGDDEVIAEREKYFKKTRKILDDKKNPANFFKVFEKANVVPTFSAVMAKKELFLCLDFNSPIKSFLDWFIWMQIAYNNKFYYLNKKLTNWRMHKKSYINDNPDECASMNVFFYEAFKALFLLSKTKRTPYAVFKFFLYWCKVFRRKIIRVHFKNKTLRLFNKDCSW